MGAFKPSYEGIGANILRAEWMVAEMRARAERGKAFAEGIAPVDESSPHPGRYKDSFEVDASAHGGAAGNRAAGILRNVAPEAVFVEFGAHDRNGNELTPEHRVLRRALGVMGA